MIKQLFQKPSEPFLSLPKSAQDTIPIQRIYADGIFCANGQYSKCWRFTDINYRVASQQEQLDIFMAYAAILNSFDTDATTKITLHNRLLDLDALEHTVHMPMQGDRLDRYRREYNQMLTDKSSGSRNTLQDKIVTVTVARRSVEEARSFFHRTALDLEKGFAQLGSRAVSLSVNERLELLHDFYRSRAGCFEFDLRRAMQRGHDFRDSICPSDIEFKAGHFIIGDRFGRALFLSDYASYIKLRQEVA